MQIYINTKIVLPDSLVDRSEKKLTSSVKPVAGKLSLDIKQIKMINFQ